MPLNILRLNQRQHHPNDRITFIKPLIHVDNPTTKAKADLFLRKVAAICYPIMKAHSLSVTTLEEHPPNREFMGRNFNGGEVIQLVLRRMPERGGGAVATYGQSAANSTSPAPGQAPHGIRVENRVGRIDPSTSDFVANDSEDGRWLPLRTVQMVMMHELAHCIQMNHSKAFWAVRNEYVVHLKVLWSRGYTGEGMWGRGQDLESGGFIESGAGGADGFVDLCGGAYRGRGRKRGKGKEKMSYAERKKRKLDKVEGKFGKGKNVGESEIGAMLSEGKPKPRVAKSKRGRELRAAAALARFERGKVEKAKEEAKSAELDEEETDSGDETKSEAGDFLLDDTGHQIKDSHGHGLYKVCGDMDAAGDADARNELSELNGVEDPDHPHDTVITDEAENADDSDDLDAASIPGTTKSPGPSTREEAPDQSSGKESSGMQDPPKEADLVSNDAHPSMAALTAPKSMAAHTTLTTTASASPVVRQRTCAICSLENDPSSATCMACAHVLDTRQIPNSWSCRSDQCRDSAYINAGDAGVCGICGAPKGM